MVLGLIGTRIIDKEREGSQTPLSSIVVAKNTFSVTMAKSGIGGEAQNDHVAMSARQISKPILLGDSTHALSMFQRLWADIYHGMEANHRTTLGPGRSVCLSVSKRISTT